MEQIEEKNASKDVEELYEKSKHKRGYKGIYQLVVKNGALPRFKIFNRYYAT